jgi:hypothetical protein
MPDAEYGHSAIELGGIIYIVGAGEDSYGLLRYDPVSGAWSTLAPLIQGCYKGASFVLGGCLYAAGGEGTESKVQRYDVIANTWTEVAGMLDGRCETGAVTIRSTNPAREQDLFDSLIAKAARRDL